jgi:hypothetical protein
MKHSFLHFLTIFNTYPDNYADAGLFMLNKTF